MRLGGAVVAIGFTGAFIVLVSCQAIVNGEVPAYTCSGSSLSACPPNQFCQGSGCTDCLKPGNDPCDGYDNDCNGLVDDGPASDRDGDGYTYCGKRDPNGGRLVDVDCNDSDATIHPGAMEVCNGKDDDCNGLVDDTACPAGTTCAPKTQMCISDTTACTPTSCPVNQICDPETLTCVMPSAKLLGDPCMSDKECRDGFCAYQSALSAAVVTQGGICTKECCTSDQCDAGFVCYPPGTGGRYCIKTSIAGVGATGMLSAGAASMSSTTCRSGVAQNGKCFDTCCHDADCTNGTVCRNSQFAGGARYGFACQDPAGPRNFGDSCDANNRCAKGICANGVCIEPCCTSNDCPVLVPYGNVVCGEVKAGAASYVSACGYIAGFQFGTAQTGTQCGANADCRSFQCNLTKPNDSNQYCQDVCCSDADCAGGKCRPTATEGAAFGLRCMF